MSMSAIAALAKAAAALDAINKIETAASSILTDPNQIAALAKVAADPSAVPRWMLTPDGRTATVEFFSRFAQSSQ